MERDHIIFRFDELDTTFLLHLHCAHHPDSLAMLMEIVYSTTENRKLLEATWRNLLE